MTQARKVPSGRSVGADDAASRDRLSGRPGDRWRPLRADERKALVANGNVCDDWSKVLVTGTFRPSLVRGCCFHGLVRIGALEEVTVDCQGLPLPAGITNSRVISCDIGDNCAVHNVGCLSNYVLGDRCRLLNVGEMCVIGKASFGNGVLSDGQDEEERIWLDIANETGARAVLPFDGMLPADAYVWAKYRGDEELQTRLVEMTQRQFGSAVGCYGIIGEGCAIRNVRAIRNAVIGQCCRVDSAERIENVTVNSTADEPTTIGAGVELVDGIVAVGCEVSSGARAWRFVLGSNCRLRQGARLMHTVLGDNSTVSCCEVLSNLIFPAHEQHHNNSFLIATLVMGQSNIAAGATIGSNHNSRCNDGEIVAGRGFWPGLCVSLKHNCRFASFTLLARGDYHYELDLPLPFALVSNDAAADRLVVMPAYWWLYNMYALERNSWKLRARDRRKKKAQHVEFEALAPDTAEEILSAMRLLEIWAAKAKFRAARRSPEGSSEQLSAMGRELLLAGPQELAGTEILAEGVENSRRKVVVIKAREGYQAYRQMLHHYAMGNLLAFMRDNPQATVDSMQNDLAGPPARRWLNFGGQLVAEEDARGLLADIRLRKLATWADVHARHDQLWQQYPLARQRHALAVLKELLGADQLATELWQRALNEAMAIQQHVCQQVYVSRKKDHDDPFRQITFSDEQEMTAVLGSIEDNAFVRHLRQETEEFGRLVESVRQRL